MTDNQIIHRQYLRSEVWKAKRIEALSHYGCKCSRCGQHGTDVHHKTYARVGGFELMADLEIMCRDCHEAHHAAERCAQGRKKTRRTKAINQQALFRVLTSTQKAQLKERFGVFNDNELFVALSYGQELTPIKAAAAKMLGRSTAYPPSTNKSQPTWGKMPTRCL